MKHTVFFIVLLLVLSACSPTPERLNNQGNRAFEQSDYGSALQDYLSAQAELPERIEPGYNAANTHYRQDDFQAAQQRLLGALQNAGEELAEFIYYNLGNAFFQTGQFDQAIESYKHALRLDPDDMDAKYNLELAMQQQEQEQESEEEGQEQNQEENEQQEEEQEQPNEQPEEGPTQEPSPSEEETQAAQQLSPEQARQLLESAAQETQSLQQYLQQIYLAPGGAPAEDW